MDNARLHHQRIVAGGNHPLRNSLALISAVAAFCAATAIAEAAPCSPSHTYVTGETLTAATLNSNPVTFSGCFSNIDNTNIGAAGLYASQLNPGNSTQATFGGGQSYTFPVNISVMGSTATAGLSDSANAVITGTLGVTGATTLTSLSGTSGTFSSTLGVTGTSTLGPVNAGATSVTSLASSGAVSGTTGSFSSTLGVTGATTLTGALNANGGSTTTGAVQQNVSSTNYTLPYDAQSTSASTNTHLEHGQLTTGAFSAGFACTTSHSFIKAYTSQPEIFLAPSSQSSGYLYVSTENASSFTACSFISGASGGTVLLHWISLGE